MPRLPSQLTYNDLNGSEAIDILCDWFRQLLQSRPELQPHLTLPMARIGLEIGISVDMYIGGTVPVDSPPERINITGAVQLDNNLSGQPPPADPVQGRHTEGKLSAVINAAPIPGGVPPDQVREQHNLPIPRPGYGPRDTGSHLFLADVTAETEQRKQAAQSPTGGREGIVAEGYVFSSEPAATGPAAADVEGALEQTIALEGRGKIDIDLSGEGKLKQGSNTIKLGPMNVASVKKAGDQGGAEYGAVAGTYDPGPAGLARSGRGGGLYSDGRSRISFGNKR